MLPFLLIAGDGYYPQQGTGDWIKCFATEREAQDAVAKIPIHNYYTKGKQKGEIKNTYYQYVVGSRKYDWYEIVDLRKWTHPR